MILLSVGISTHTPLARRDWLAVGIDRNGRISTHTPLARRDYTLTSSAEDHAISTHTPHAGRDRLFADCLQNLFISTHTPHAGRDKLVFKLNKNGVNFYSHAPCGARHKLHSPNSSSAGFLLTRPMRGATDETTESLQSFLISTHTPHAGRDVRCILQKSASKHFYSHAPCGARPHERHILPIQQIFLLTRPMRGATCLC